MAKLSSVICPVLLLLLHTLLFVSGIEPGCENCGCCVNKVCAPKNVDGLTVHEYCTHGCISGTWGRRCYNPCSSQCLSCDQNDKNICKSCVEGKYLSSGRCLSCNERCKSCTSATLCQKCKDPYFNAGGVTDCSLSCPGNCICHDVGSCSSCQDGYYNIQSQCQEPCPDKCQTCSDLNTCQTCNDGYYNGKEFDNANSYEISDCSLSCRDNCTRCDSYNQCLHCKQGYHGMDCQKTCSEGCQNGVCAIADGSCACKVGFTGSTCSDCTAGRYGNECELPCPITCKDDKCERYTGHCDYCKEGMYGQNCAFNCPSNRCSDSTCDRYTGNCTACQHGFYGSLCDLSCSSSCKNGSCNFLNGSCLECSTMFSGDKCCIQNGHCLKCSSNTACETCSDGFYGVTCEKKCLAVCSNAKKMSGALRCERKSGICSGCKDGFHGEFCDRACRHQCLNNRCNKDNGHCSDGCLDGYTGPTCADALNTLGIGIGISSVVTIVIATILMTTSCIIIRKWFKKVHDTMKQLQETRVQTSYFNTEFQPETVHLDDNDNAGLCDIQEYEELNERIQMKTTDYDQI